MAMVFENEQVSLRIESTDLTVAPGASINVPLLLHNQSPADGVFTLTVSGIPGNWVSVPAPVIRLAAGEQRQVQLTIQPPSPPVGRAGRHQVVIRLAEQETLQQAAEAVCTLTVAELEVPGRIGILLAATEFPVVPGESVAFPLVLLNRGLDAGTFALSVEGIPSGWVYAPVVAVSLAPGQQQEMRLSIQPPASAQVEAGRHPFRIQVSSQVAPGQVAEAACVLAITTFGGFHAELRPQRVEAGKPARVLVENQGNVQQDFTVDWQSPGSDVIFEPGAAQHVRVPPGEVGLVEFRPAPRSRPFLGGEVSHPFTTRIQTPDRQSQHLTGEVVTRGLLPTWVLAAVAIAILALIAAIALIAVLDTTNAPPAEVPPAVETEVPPAEAPPAVETEVPPAEAPPAVETAVPPVEAPPEAPVEAPPDAPTEVAVQLPAGEPAPTREPPPGSGGVELPCLPAAFGLIFVPLLARSRRPKRKE